MIVLLVDSDGDRARAWQTALQRAGAKVYSSPEFDQASEMAARVRADLVVLVHPPESIRLPNAVILEPGDPAVFGRGLSLLGDAIARTARREPARILCVDDEAFFLQALDRLLRSSGYRTMTAASVDEARKCLDERPDLAIVDIRLPGADGLSFVDELRARFGADFPVVLLTGCSTDEDIAEGYRRGASYYICKPCPPKQILGIVDYLVGSLNDTERQILETQL